MSNTIQGRPTRRIQLDHNPVDGDSKNLYSAAHQGPEWAGANYSTGQHCVRLLDLHLITGLFTDFLFTFQDQDSGFVKFFSNTWNAISGALYGKREEEMYTNVYCAGADALEENDYSNQSKILTKTNFVMDDSHEMAHFLKDKVINFLWKGTTNISKWSPAVFFGSAFLGKKWSDFIFSFSQTWSRATWRFSYLLPTVFHNNVVGTGLNLIKLKFLSMFTKGYKQEYDSFTNNVANMAYEYAKKTYENESSLNGKAGVSAYFWMLKDRLWSHWEGIKDPQKILSKKAGKDLIETTKEERKTNPERNLDQGYVIPTSSEDKDVQRRVSIVNFTAPFCAAVGLIGTLVFEPLRCIWNVSGLERGKGVLSFLANLRGPASLTNYFFKFFKLEQEIGNLGLFGNRELRGLQKYIDDGTANEAIQHLYQAKRNRLVNSYLGIVTLAGSFVDSFGQLSRSFDTENRTQNFIFSVLSRFVNFGFVRFFSARRRDWGREEQIHLAAKEALIAEGKIKRESELTRENFDEINDIDNAKFNEALNKLSRNVKQVPEQNPIDRLFRFATNTWGSITGIFKPSLSTIEIQDNRRVA